MRLAAFYPNYFMNSQIRSVLPHQSYTAGSMAKELVKGIDATKLRTEKELINELKKVNEATNQLNKKINKLPDYKLEALKHTKNWDYNNKNLNLLDSSSKLIQGTRNSVFHEPGINSTQPKVAEITEIKRLHPGSKGFELTVHALAKHQVTVFAPIKEANSAKDLRSGFKITVSGREFDIKTENKEEKSGEIRSNEMIVKELADKLNQLDIGIQAKVEKKTFGTVLSLSSVKTGTEHSFKITDEIGMIKNNKELQKASDAVYSINNGNDSKEYKAASNEVLLNYHGVNLQLKEIGTTKLSFDGINKEKVFHAIKDMINDYNIISDKVTKNQTKRFEMEKHKEALHKIGINYDGFNNKFSIDKKRQEAAIEHNIDEFKKMIGGKEGLASKIRDYANENLRSEKKNNSFSELKNSFHMKSAHDKGANHSWSNNQPILSKKNLYGFDRLLSYGSPMSHGFIQ